MKHAWCLNFAISKPKRLLWVLCGRYTHFFLTVRFSFLWLLEPCLAHWHINVWTTVELISSNLCVSMPQTSLALKALWDATISASCFSHTSLNTRAASCHRLLGNYSVCLRALLRTEQYPNQMRYPFQDWFISPKEGDSLNLAALKL